MQDKINLSDKLSLFSEHWTPKIVARYNENDIMVAKVKGEFIWHAHPDTDDLFLVLKGHLVIELPERTIQLGPGDLFVVPAGMEHRPIAEEEAHILLIEPSGTPNTGNEATAVTKESL